MTSVVKWGREKWGRTAVFLNTEVIAFPRKSQKLRFDPTFLALLLPLFALADEAPWDIAGSVEVQSRLFAQDPLWPGQASQVGHVSVALSAELRWRSAHGNQRASLIPYARWDGTDAERSIFDLREAYWAYEADAFELLLGANTVFWGVTESVHLVDIVNQTDAVADVDGEDKLGQPMVNLALQRDWGLVNIYLLPYFRERTFAGVEGRLRLPLPIEADGSLYASSQGDKHLDLALRYSHYIGNVDIGLSLFSGTSREPRIVPSADGTRLLPYYDQIDQAGIDLQYTRNAWLWKLEAIVRDGFSQTFAAAVGGFEYTFYQVRDSAADIGLLIEYQYDGRNELEPFTIADNDVFVGTRLALNDIQDTAVLVGVAYDIDTGEAFINVEAERRIGENFFLEIRLRAFAGASPQDRTHAVARDDYLQLQIARYF